MRQMERVPNVSANHVIPGEVSVHGRANKGTKSLKSRYTKIPCLYHRYLKEREEKDSDGDTRWVTVESGSEGTDFFLGDETGKVLVKLSRKGVRPDLYRDHRERQGRYRYSEWRIEERERVYAFAMAKEDAEGLSLRFDLPGSFTPILSNDGALENRSDYGTKAVLFSALSLSLFCFACLSCCFLFRIHRVLVFLSIVSFLVFSVLLYFSMNLMRSDLVDGFERISRLERSANVQVEKLLGKSFDWATVSESSRSLAQTERDRVMGIRDDYLESIARTNSIRNRFPEMILAPLWGIDSWPMPNGVTSEEQGIIQKTPVKAWVVAVSLFSAAIVIALGVYFGFRRIKIKRYIENIPTSLASGLAYGPAEIKGSVKFSEGAFVKGPETRVKCVYFRHKITEKRRSGKSTKTVVIKDETKYVNFLCEDREGKTLIDPKGAEVSAELKIRRKKGRRTYYEWHLPKDVELYVLGSAVVDEKAGDRLMLSDGNDDFPFLISDESETETMLRQSRKGLKGIGYAQNATVFSGMIIFGGLGSFAATDFLMAASFAPLFLALSMVALMYNDLVFLLNRTKRAWANIEVSLKKRADLLPNLEKVVRTYLSHEKGVLDSLAELRGAVVGVQSYTPAQADQAMRREFALSSRLIALREAYPDLKANRMMEDFMNRLTRMENEISMMRAGYNDGVERYLTVKRRIPEVILARALKFQDVDLLTFSSEVREVPSLQTDDGNLSIPKTSEAEPLKQPIVAAKSEKQAVPEAPLPTSPKSINLYLWKNDRMEGPFDLAKVRELVAAGVYQKNDLACWDGKNWKSVSKIPGFS